MIKQVTRTDSLAAPVYGTSAQPTSFKRKGGGVDGRGARAPSRGGGGGLLGALLCCIPARKEDMNDEVRRTTRDEPAHRERPDPIAIVEFERPEARPVTDFRKTRPCREDETDPFFSQQSSPSPRPQAIHHPTAALAAHRVVPEAQAMHSGDPFLPPRRARTAASRASCSTWTRTLVHSSFKPVPNPDFVIPVEIVTGR